MPPKIGDEFKYPDFHMKFFVNDTDGRVEIKLGGAQVIECNPLEEDRWDNPLFKLDPDMNYTIHCKTRYCRGLFDSLIGIRTIHAWRYQRLQRRHKEKERRMKLKGEKLK